MFKIEGHQITPTVFPDKTSQIWKLPEEILEGQTVTIWWRFESEAEIIQLAQLCALLDRYYVPKALFISYLPYGRQDKLISNDTTFGLKPFADIINSLNFTGVMLTDPHSDVATRLIQRSRAHYPVDEICRAYRDVGAKYAVYPDAGASKKYSKLLPFIPHVSGNKVRNPSTGAIENYELPYLPGIKTVLVIDDICDGGATFIHLAKALQDQAVWDLNLYVSHGIFSKGTQVLIDAGYKRIFTKEGEITCK